MGGIKLTVNFDLLMEKIQSAGGNVEKVALDVAKKSADVVSKELKNECNAKGVPASVSSEIKTTVTQEDAGTRYACAVGWKMGDYNPRNPTTGYKAVFLNYGTPRRKVKTDKMRLKMGNDFRAVGRDRGAVEALGFIESAKKSARKKVKKIQEEALQEALKELKQ